MNIRSKLNSLLALVLALLTVTIGCTCHAGQHSCLRQTSQRCRRCRNSKHFSPSQPRPESAAIALQRVQGQSE
jgi:hypothetical protein